MPRSFRTDGDLVKPVSFLGLIFIYGNLAKLFGTAAIPYFTPAFAALGLVFFLSHRRATLQARGCHRLNFLARCLSSLHLFLSTQHVSQYSLRCALADRTLLLASSH